MSRIKKKNTSIGCLFWIALILLVLVVFLFNREAIQSVLDETGFIEILQKNRESKKPDVETIPTETEDKTEEETKQPVIVDNSLEETEKDNKNIIIEETPKEDAVEITIVPENEAELKEPEPVVEREKKMRKSKLYFAEVMDSGDISFKSVTRPIYYNDSPLTETMKALLLGLSGAELNMGLISLIPDGCNLISVSVKNNIAFLNFSESFRFNAFGAEGSIAQLKQIVYTATEFKNINAVQIMIEGSVNEYLSSEGVYIGKPLKRTDF